MRTGETIPAPTNAVKHGPEAAPGAGDDLDDLAACAALAALFLDGELRLRRFTPAAAALYGLGPADLGRPLSDLAHRVRGQALPASLAPASEPLRDEIVAADGRIYERSALALRGGDGQLRGVVLSHEEVTQGRAAAEAQRFTERFLSLLSHDLRNPLAAIKLTAASLLRRGEAAPLLRQIHRIDGSASRMERMIAQLLDLGRIRIGGGLRLRPTPLDLRELAGAVPAELPEPDRAALSISVEGDGRGTWDRERLLQLLANLAANARQHGAPGATATLRIEGSGDEVRVEVRSRGAVPEALRPHLFSPLPLVDGLAPRAGAGLGLGLWLCRQIAEGHGGSIDLRCDEDETLVAVRLPRRAKAPPA